MSVFELGLRLRTALSDEDKARLLRFCAALPGYCEGRWEKSHDEDRLLVRTTDLTDGLFLFNVIRAQYNGRGVGVTRV